MERIWLLSSARSGHNFIYDCFWRWTRSDPDIQITGFRWIPPIEVVVKQQPIMVILNMRPLVNTFASLFRWLYDSGMPNPDMLVIWDREMSKWNTMAKEAAGVTDYVENTQLCNFERFITDRPYREQLCTLVGGVYDQSFMQQLHPKSNGSAFDGHTYEGNAFAMPLNTRYSQIPDPLKPQFHNLLARNKEAVQTYIDVFNITDPDALALANQIINS